MAKYDNSTEVGAQGDADALTYNQQLTSRGICSKYFLHDKSPAYPERFARSPVISDNLPSAAQANPSAYPVFSGLNVVQQQYVEGQIDDMYSAHQFFSDFNKTTIKFLDVQCQ